MVSHIFTPHYLSFSEEYDKSLRHPHNLALHIEVQIYHTRVCQVLIDNDTRLNIVSFHVVQQLGLSKFTIDPRCKITIKAYDEVERSSKGLIILLVWVGLVEKDIVFQVLDILLTYNLLLERPWLHEMQVVPST